MHIHICIFKDVYSKNYICMLKDAPSVSFAKIPLKMRILISFAEISLCTDRVISANESMRIFIYLCRERDVSAEIPQRYLLTLRDISAVSLRYV